LLLPACQQKMARQPSYKPLQVSDFFRDHRASRPLIDGTVPRGKPLDDDPLVRYLKRSPGKNAPALEDYVDVFPLRMDRAALLRGQERFRIFCYVCHDELGTGHGKIVERGYLQPPSYHTDNSRGFERRGKLDVPLRDVPVGYIFEVITRGMGAMPDYASQIAPADRWKIIAYVRVLQRSQRTPLKELPADKQRQARQELEENP
jgi:hypothetical protein